MPSPRWPGAGALRGMPATSMLANIGGWPCGVKRTPLASSLALKLRPNSLRSLIASVVPPITSSPATSAFWLAARALPRRAMATCSCVLSHIQPALRRASRPRPRSTARASQAGLASLFSWVSAIISASSRIALP
ncbi:hypothetical protein G6F68_018235 [Rhizopus microsporus]|nr:hypothetical protein G6F68_018235 [Rhizopus microsporus]